MNDDVHISVEGLIGGPIDIRVSADFMERLKAVAREHGVSLETVIEDALALSFERRGETTEVLMDRWFASLTRDLNKGA